MTNDTDIKEKLSTLIKDADLERLELELKQPNFFYLLKIQETEVRHSNFLAWLLSPSEGHGLRDLVLRRFLKDIFSSDIVDWIDEFSADQLDLSGIEIRREWRHIDLLIVAAEFVICIENKVMSSEHTAQLKRYKEAIEESFPEKHHAFVFLTPHGREPENPDDAAVYQTYSYHDVAGIIESLLQIHGESLSVRNRIYIEDYLKVIRRGIMKDDAVNDLARKIYDTHSEALDFIFENKPDRLAEISSIFEKLVHESEWVLGSPNKGYARFLTPELDKVIPKSGVYGWKHKEAFLFQLDYWPKRINFCAAISPGKDEHRRVLSDAILSLDGAERPRGKMWWTFFNNNWKFDVTSDQHTDDDIEKKLRDIWPEIEKLVTRVEATILKKADSLVP